MIYECGEFYMKRIAVLTSGGDAPGMNACIRAVVRKALSLDMEVIGVRKGFCGLISGDFMELKSRTVGDILQRGGTMLQTARCDEFTTEDGRAKALLQMKTCQIDALVGIGGNGTFAGLEAFSRMGVPVIAIPATIDNDVDSTELSIGFDTACNTVVDAINNIRDTATSHERTYVIEVMGRHCGSIALVAGLAGGAESILIPEADFDINRVCAKVLSGMESGKKHSIVVVAEGACKQPEDAADCDGSAYYIGRQIRGITGLETRITVLGHIQRGGAPTVNDRILATRLGASAVEMLANGVHNVTVGVCGGDICTYNVSDALQMRKRVDLEYLELAEILSGM